MDNEDFILRLDGLKAGSSHFVWHADGKFFGGFENSGILDADIEARIQVDKSASFIGVDCLAQGTVTVVCDRCLADLTLPVDTAFGLDVRFGTEDGPAEENGREIVYLPDRETGLDLGQILYDYVCISLPMVRVHAEGECDPEVVRHLGVPSLPEEGQDVDDARNPFASLKTLLEK